MSLSKSIKELDPDFVITYSNKSDEQDLQEFVKLLFDNGLYAQVRDLNDSSLLIFIKLAGYKFTELAEKEKIKNYEFGITCLINTKADKLRITYEYLSGNTVDDLNLFQNKNVKDITPITESVSDTTAFEDVKSHLFGTSNPSSEFIKENFGVHIALYFEFLKHFIVWLVGLSVLGLVSYFKSKHLFSLTYCGVTLLWGTLFLAFWRKKEKYLVNLWGAANSHLLQDYKSELVEVNESYEEKSGYKHKGNHDGVKFVKQLVFVPVAIGFAAVLVAYQLGCFVLEIFINEVWDGPYKQFIALVPTLLLSVFVPILTMVFNIVSDILIKFENHNNDYTKNNSVLIKQFVLNFLTSYMPLIITAFIYLPFAHLIQYNLGNIQDTISQRVSSDAFYYKYLVHIKSQEEFKMNQERLNVQYFYFTVTNQVVQLIMKYGLPQILGIVFGLLKKSDYEAIDKSNEKTYLSSVRKYVALPSYNVNDDLRFVTVVYGYLILFGPVWSLAPVVTLVFLIITLKLDYLKLINGKYFKPPIPHRVDSIYPWNYALFGLTWLGSVVSPAITAFYHHGDKPPKTLGQFALDKASVNISSSKLIVILLLSEHSFLILSLLLSKLLSLFKTDIEWENDFTENDIKLRRDFYSGKIKGSLDREDDAEWSLVNPSLSLSQAKQILSGSFSDETETIQPKATLTGVDFGKGSKAIVSDKADLLDAKLLDIKDETDKIIKVPTETADKVFATIDDNTHVTSEESNEYQKDYEASSTPDPQVAQDVDTEDDSTKKKRGLKKLLKKRK